MRASTCTDDCLWVPGRDEADFKAGAAFFSTDDEGIERWLRIDRDTLRFRWPPREG